MSLRKTGQLHQAVDLAISDGADHVLVQAGMVFAESECYGCGHKGVITWDRFGAWCARCGGRELVPGAIDLDYTLDTGKAFIGGSNVIHLAEPGAKTTLCLPCATIGRMRSAASGVSVTCPRCIAVRDLVPGRPRPRETP